MIIKKKLFFNENTNSFITLKIEPNKNISLFLASYRSDFILFSCCQWVDYPTLWATHFAEIQVIPQKEFDYTLFL